MGDTDKARENALRRQAKRLGLVLRKSRARHWSLHNQGGYMVIDAEYNAVAQGSDFELTLDDVAEYLEKYERELREGGATR